MLETLQLPQPSSEDEFSLTLLQSCSDVFKNYHFFKCLFDSDSGLEFSTRTVWFQLFYDHLSMTALVHRQLKRHQTSSISGVILCYIGQLFIVPATFQTKQFGSPPRIVSTRVVSNSLVVVTVNNTSKTEYVTIKSACEDSIVVSPTSFGSIFVQQSSPFLSYTYPGGFFGELDIRLPQDKKVSNSSLTVPSNSITTNIGIKTQLTVQVRVSGTISFGCSTPVICFDGPLIQSVDVPSGSVVDVVIDFYTLSKSSATIDVYLQEIKTTETKSKGLAQTSNLQVFVHCV
ncbi:hypothetical protein GEMRC1_000059 [Eukaryota sp. GEM-RC1]